MKRWFLMFSVVAAMLVLASSAFAGGINLAWTSCAALGGLQNKTFACNSNSGSNAMVGTFVEDAAHVQVSGVEVIIDLITADASINATTDWWSFKNVGACRQNSISGAAYNGDGTSCADWAAGQASMNIASYVIGGIGANTARIKMVNSVAATAYAALDASTEYGAFNITVNNAKTVGTGACAGCLSQACIVFNSINVTTAGNADNRFYGNGTAAGSNIITWQGTTPGANCSAVPTRNATWGGVKALYR